MKILQVEKVVKRYGNFEAVKGISLSLDSGKTLAVLDLMALVNRQL